MQLCNLEEQEHVPWSEMRLVVSNNTRFHQMMTALSKSVDIRSKKKGPLKSMVQSQMIEHIGQLSLI